jgi:hypothetical protein
MNGIHTDKAELITKEPLREGSVFKVNTVFNNREMLLKYEVVEWGEPLRASLKTETKGFEIVDTLFFFSYLQRDRNYLLCEH